MRLNFLFITMIAVLGLTMTSCGSDTESQDFGYDFNADYAGTHENNLGATVTVEELEAGGSMITVELTNTVEGETYPMHVHDAADAATTPNMTPYVEAPNANIFATNLVGTGGTVSTSATTTMSFTELTTTYDGFFVVHDPLQDINTADLSTFLIVAAFAR